MKCEACLKEMSVIDKAKAEVCQEKFNRRVEAEVEKLKSRSWNFFPYTIEIKRKVK